MSSTASQVRVRLSADGVRDVVQALRTVEKQAQSTAGARGLGGLTNAFRNLKGILPAIGIGAAVAGFSALAKTALSNADALGKLSAKTGASTEDLSALAVAGRTAGVSLEQIQSGIVKSSVAVGNLKNGNEAAQKSFAKLGLAAKDFQNLNPAQSYELIAKRLLSIGDSAQMAAVGADILGRSFADQIPLLRAVADEGLDGLRQRAEQLGLLITGDLAAAAESANDSFTIIKMHAEGLATSFVSGLAPSIVAAMGDFSSSIEGDGVKQMQRFGQETGRVLRVVIQTFRTFFNIVSGVFQGIGNQIGALAAIIAQLSKGNFSEAVRIWKDSSAQERADFNQFKEQFKSDVNRLVAEATREAPAVTVKTRVDDEALKQQVQSALDKANASGASAKADAAAKRAAAEAKRDADKLARDLEREAEAQARRVESAAAARFDLEQKLLEASGRTADARLRALDEEIKKYEEVFAAANGGQVSQEDQETLVQFRFKRESGINFEALAAEGQAALEELSIARERIEQDVQLGITSQYQGQQQILDIERQRIVVLEELAASMLAAAQASGSPELIAQAEEFARQVGQVRISVDNVTDAFTRLSKGAEDALQGGLTDVLANLQDFESVGDVFKSLASTVAGALQQIAAEMLATYITSMLLRSVMSAFCAPAPGAKAGGPIGRKWGGAIGYADGGAVNGTGGGLLRGPGSSLSDSIRAFSPSGPVLLSDGEFIVRAAAVRQPGVLSMLKTINAGASAMGFSPRAMPRRFADGGALSSDMAPAGAAQGAGFAGVIGLEPGLVMKQLESESFDRLLVKRLERNRTSLKSIVGS
jgi:hypothetical protein